MAKNRQSDLFRESKPFPEDLSQAENFNAIEYYKKWYYIFLFHIQKLEDNKPITDEISSRIAQEILESNSLDTIQEPELKVRQLLDIEISHIVIDLIYRKQLEWFHERGLKNSEIKTFLKKRRERADKIDTDNLSKELRTKIETSITYFELIDEEISNDLLE